VAEEFLQLSCFESVQEMHIKRWSQSSTEVVVLASCSDGIVRSWVVQVPLAAEEGKVHEMESGEPISLAKQESSGQDISHGRYVRQLHRPDALIGCPLSLDSPGVSVPRSGPPALKFATMESDQVSTPSIAVLATWSCGSVALWNLSKQILPLASGAKSTVPSIKASPVSFFRPDMKSPRRQSIHDRGHRSRMSVEDVRRLRSSSPQSETSSKG